MSSGQHPQSDEPFLAEFADLPGREREEAGARRRAYGWCVLAVLTMVAVTAIVIAKVFAVASVAGPGPYIIAGTMILMSLVATGWTLVGNHQRYRGVAAPALSGILLSLLSLVILLGGVALRAGLDAMQTKMNNAAARRTNRVYVRPREPLPTPFSDGMVRPRLPEPRPLQSVRLSIDAQDLEKDLEPQFDPQNGVAMHRVKRIDPTQVVDVQWSRDGSEAYVLTQRGLTKVSVPAFVCERFLPLEHAQSMAWSTKGLLVLDDYGNVYVVDPGSLAISARIENEELRHVFCAPDKSMVLGVSLRKKCLTILDVQQGRALRTISEQTLAGRADGSFVFRAPHVSRDGTFIAFVDKDIQLFRRAGDDVKFVATSKLPAEARVRSVQFDETNTALVVIYELAQSDAGAETVFHKLDLRKVELPTSKFVLGESSNWAALPPDLGRRFVNTSSRGLQCLNAQGDEQFRIWLSDRVQGHWFAPKNRGLLLSTGGNLLWIDYARGESVTLPPMAVLPTARAVAESLPTATVEQFTVPCTELKSLVASHAGSPAWSSDGKHLYLFDEQLRPVRIQREGWQVTHRLEAPSERDADFLLTSAGVVVASNNKKALWVLDPDDLRPRSSYALSSMSVCVSAPASPYVAVLGKNSTGMILLDVRNGRVAWRMSAGQLQALVREAGVTVDRDVLPRQLAMTSDGKRLFCLCPSLLLCFSITNGEHRLEQWTQLDNEARSLTLSPDARHLAVQVQARLGDSSLRRAQWRIYSTDDLRTPLHTFDAPPANRRLEFHAAQPLVYVTSDERPIACLDFAGKDVRGGEPIAASIRHVAFAMAARPQSDEVLLHLTGSWLLLDFEQ
jgi:hypothetical protein